jgi:hypothetical protein
MRRTAAVQLRKSQFFSFFAVADDYPGCEKAGEEMAFFSRFLNAFPQIALDHARSPIRRIDSGHPASHLARPSIWIARPSI